MWTVWQALAVAGIALSGAFALAGWAWSLRRWREAMELNRALFEALERAHALMRKQIDEAHKQEN
jgi:hypothetical protein